MFCHSITFISVFLFFSLSLLLLLHFFFHSEGDLLYESNFSKPHDLYMAQCYPTGRFAILLHGWREGCNTTWMKQLIRSLLISFCLPVFFFIFVDFENFPNNNSNDLMKKKKKKITVFIVYFGVTLLLLFFRWLGVNNTHLISKSYV